MRKQQITRFTTSLLAYILVFTLIAAHVSTGMESGSISITASPTTITTGENTTISGSITPASVGETVTIWYRINGTAAPWGILATVTTNATSQYSYIWTALAWGTFELKATWIGDTYAAESSIITVDVKAPPNASFIYTPDTPAVDETIAFDASASYDPDGTIETYAWDFGDGTTGTGVTTTHAYTPADTYDVTLTVTDNDTLTDTETKSITISLQLQPPVASFIHSPTEPQVNETVTFNASASYDPDGTIDSYEWTFGDGTNTTETDPITTHAYIMAGTYNVTLTITDNANLTNSASADITVSPAPEPPVASFTYEPIDPFLNQNVTFDASASTPDGGDIVSYEWNFGDGTTGTGMNVTHAYADYGNFTVTLNVTDSEGLWNATTGTVRVYPHPPIVSFTFSPLTPYINETVMFNATGSYDPDGDIVWYYWSFGDDTYLNATDQIAQHAYVDNGTYTVTLVVSDNEGLNSTASAIVTVPNRPPVAIFTESAEIVLTSLAIYFDASDSYDPDGSILNYFWDFGDGTNATMCVILDHSFAQNGEYLVTLTLTDDDGTSSSASATMTVKGSSGWPLYLIAGTALGIAGLTGAVIYIIFRRKRKTANETTAPENKPFITLYVPRSLFAGYEKLTKAADNSVVLRRT